MKVLLIFALISIADCSEEEVNEEKDSDTDNFISHRLCGHFGKEGITQECLNCARQTAAQTEPKNYDELSKNNIPKTKEILIKCSNFFINSEQLVECTKLDAEEFITCYKTVFPEGVKKTIALHFCFQVDKIDECQQCVFDSFKKGWEKTYKTPVKREASDTDDKYKINELMENDATEIANNCHHLFNNEDKIKECANKEFGKRMECIYENMDNYRENKNLDLCLYMKEEVMEGDCDKCVSEAISSEEKTDDDDNNDDDDGKRFLLQQKENYKKALEKCGQYIEKQEDMLECTKKEAEEVLSCLDDIFVNILDRKLATKMCKINGKSDKCVDCVYQSLQNAWRTVSNDTSAESDNDDEIDHLDELEATEISTNCHQHFQKDEALKECSSKEYGTRMACLIEVLSTDDQ